MKLYGGLLSPFVRKVAVAASEKGMEYDLVLAGPGRPDPDFAQASPFGKIPAIRDGDFTLADSSAIVTYLEARQPFPALFPAEARARGKAVWFDEFADTIFAASALKILFNRLVGPKIVKVAGNEEVALQGEAELPRILDYLESAVPADGWLAGDFSLGDISVASVIKTLTYVGHGPDATKYPCMAAWYGRVSKRAGWQAVEILEAPLMKRFGPGAG